MLTGVQEQGRKVLLNSNRSARLLLHFTDAETEARPLKCLPTMTGLTGAKSGPALAALFPPASDVLCVVQTESW